MLSLYGSLKAPGVDYVTIYRDDEDPHQFYMVPERPSIARDEQGVPLFTFILYARDLDRIAPEDREIERGYISLSTRVGVPQADEEKIRAHLATLLNGELQRGRHFLLRPILRAEPKLSYPSVFTDGSVEISTFGDDMVRVSAGSKEPSLVGENLASFSQALSQDGAEFFRQSIEKGLVPSIVLYKLNFLARIPAVTIHIHGDRRQFYEELKQLCYITETHTRNGRVVSRKTWPEIGSLKEFMSKFHSLQIDIDSGDFREGNPDEDVTQKLEELAFRILESNILPSFFEPGFSPATEEQSKDKWLTELEREQTGTIDVWVRRRDVIRKAVNPNAQLARMLTPQEVKTQTSYLDLSQTAFSELDIKINANVNFAADPVFALNVFVDYNQKDELRDVVVARSDEFLFKTGNELHRFRQIMANGPASSLSTANQTFELTKDKPSAVYFTYIGGAEEPQPYSYQVTFQLADGQRMEQPAQTGNASTITITNPFEQTLTTRFLAQGDFSVVQKIIIDARYHDTGNDFSKSVGSRQSCRLASSLMAPGLERPACGSRHPIRSDTYYRLPSSVTTIAGSSPLR